MIFDEIEEKTSQISPGSLSVSQYNKLLHDMVCIADLYIEGEISEINHWRDKFTYITLKDINDSTVSTSIFAITPSVFGIKNFTIGDVVVVHGHPGVHGKSGKLSFSIKSIRKLYIEGLYTRQKEELIKKLRSEGLLSTERKRLYRRIYNRIALITAYPSQAYNDFVKIYNERFGQGIIDIYMSKMQGVDTDISSILALNSIDRSDIKYDCIVIARGGGSKEDLMPFDSEELAYKIFSSKYMVISAIGHEGDISIADLVADIRASTPSNAAEIVSTPSKLDIRKEIDFSFSYILENIRKNIDNIQENALLSIENIVFDFKAQQEALEVKVDNLFKLIKAYNINNTLERGFSIITDTSDKPITNHDQIISENIYSIYLKNGKKKEYRIKRND